MEQVCQNCKKGFSESLYSKEIRESLGAPQPTWCPECRFIRRLMWRNERAYYKRACDLCKKNIISLYPAESSFPVYCHECYNGDGWDRFALGKEYDFSQPFFVQYKELLSKTPRVAMYQYESTKSEYANFIGHSNNIYLSMSVVDQSENVFYSKNITHSTNLYDCLDCLTCENCYENIGCTSNYGCQFAVNSKNCVSSQYLFDCQNCTDCFMSSNLRNKQYYIRNQQVSKEEYAKFMEGLKLGVISPAQLEKEFYELYENSIHRYANNINAVDSTGDNLKNVKSCFNSFSISDGENLAYCHRTPGLKESADVNNMMWSARGYEYSSGGAQGSSDMRFSTNMFRGNLDTEYADHCGSCSHIFGCISLKNAEYCILNKKYSKEEYEKLVPEIRKQMDEMPFTDEQGRVFKYGEFFPPALSMFAYNETTAQEYFPKSEASASEFGVAWKNRTKTDYGSLISPQELRGLNRSDAASITGKAVACDGSAETLCSGAYRILPEELDFYNRFNIPLPTQCPNCRYFKRLNAFCNPLKLWQKKCMCQSEKHDHGSACENQFQTTYGPERKELVYCESCYQKEVL